MDVGIHLLNNKAMNIRLEKPADYREVEKLTREAFWNVHRPGCVEHFVLNQYRSNPDFIPELDFVMEEEGRIIGHVIVLQGPTDAAGRNLQTLLDLRPHQHPSGLQAQGLWAPAAELCTGEGP